MDGDPGQQWQNEPVPSDAPIEDEDGGSIIATTPEPQADPDEQFPTDNNLRTVIAEADVLIIYLEKTIAKVEAAKTECRRRQKYVGDRILALEKAGNFMKRKIPVQRYLPPYFRDSDQMYAPYSEEGMRRINMTIFDPMLREEKRWGPKDLAILREAVHNEMIEVATEEFITKRDQLRERLRESGQDAAQQDVEQWKERIELYGRKIAFEKNRSVMDLVQSVDVRKMDWVKINNLSFDGLRRAEALRLKWVNELSPIWNQDPWTEREKRQLQQLREKKKESWPLIANRLQTRRSPWQCFQKYRTDCYQNKAHEEDKRLIHLCNTLKTVNGRIQWEKGSSALIFVQRIPVTYYMKGRNRQSVRTRYMRKLDKFVKHGPWTDQEDLLLITAVNRIGSREWSKIAKAIPCRTDAQCRERWVSVMDRRIPREWSQHDDEKLICLVAAYGLENWLKCSRHLSPRSSVQCRDRYTALMLARSRFYAARERNTEPEDENKNSLVKVIKVARKSQVYKKWKEPVTAEENNMGDEQREAMEK